MDLLTCIMALRTLFPAESNRSGLDNVPSLRIYAKHANNTFICTYTTGVTVTNGTN